VATLPVSETTLESQSAAVNTITDIEDQENAVPMAPIEESDIAIEEEQHYNAGSIGHSHTEVDNKSNSHDYPLIASILLGDFFHNFTDGIFLGNAWLFCERHVAYAMVAATLYHEFAQEFADFCLLTRHCGLKVSSALVLNFVSGTSVMMGGFLILAADMTPEATGITLAMSAGVYVYVATSECLPRIQENRENKTFRNRMVFMLFFSLGAVPIGLVLINHSHGCE
jgi:zinc transporter ZupT